MSKADISAQGALDRADRVIVKIGSAILCDEDGRPNAPWMASVAADIADLRRRGAAVIIVTSGAVAFGRNRLGLSGPLRLEQKQAASSAGQAALTDAWGKAFAPHDQTVAQILLTREDAETRRRYLNARATINALLDLGALPIVNENDTVATDEIRYGDNDRLAAHIVQMTGADVLVILSDIDGLYTADPHRHRNARHISAVDTITPEILAAAAPERRSGVGSGGMATKLEAAKIAGASGCMTIIARGRGLHPIKALRAGARATCFTPSDSRENARRRWIAGVLNPKGTISLDAGAAKAARSGASLLPAGAIKIDGDFRRGDVVIVEDEKGDRLGQGVSAYDASDLKEMKGRSSDEIYKRLGYRRRPAMIERNDFVLIDKGTTDAND